jgi:hypothetical protein
MLAEDWTVALSVRLLSARNDSEEVQRMRSILDQSMINEINTSTSAASHT